MISSKEGSVGGLESVVLELSKFLIRNGVNVTIFQESNRDAVKLTHGCAFEFLRPYDLLPSKLRFAFYDKYVYSLKAYQKIKSQNSFDIIHGHGDNCFFPVMFRYRRPFVFNIHGVKRSYRTREFGSNSRILKSPRYFPMYWPEEMAAKRSDVVVAVSEAERDELTHFYGIDHRTIKVIYNGVDVHKFRPMDKKTARRILGLPENSNYAIWVGSSNPTMKGLSIAIKAVKGFKNLHLLVVGVSGDDFGNVLYRGNVPDFQLLAHYNAADFFLFPSLHEGFGIVALEALACGLPIIISEECPVREIIRNGIEGYVIEKRKPEDYAEKMKTILSDSAWYSEASLACRKLAEKYSWEKTGKEYLKLYLQLVR
jgi:D-inositol-3-phosphate glycosyltransferase